MTKNLQEIIETIHGSKVRYFSESREWMGILEYEILKALEPLKNKPQKEIAHTKITLTFDLHRWLNLIDNLEKVLELKNKLEEKQQIIDELGQILKKAYAAYYSSGDQQSKRLRNMAKILGCTDGSGKRGARINDRLLYYQFLELTMGSSDPLEKKPAISKSEAYEILKNKYDLQSAESVRKKIANTRKKMKEDAKKVDWSKFNR